MVSSNTVLQYLPYSLRNGLASTCNTHTTFWQTSVVNSGIFLDIFQPLINIKSYTNFTCYMRRPDYLPLTNAHEWCKLAVVNVAKFSCTPKNTKLLRYLNKNRISELLKTNTTTITCKYHAGQNKCTRHQTGWKIVTVIMNFILSQQRHHPSYLVTLDSREASC